MAFSKSLFLLALASVQFEKVLGFSIPQKAVNASLRRAQIDLTRAGFLYGPPVAGGPAYPNGTLGQAKVAADVANEQLEAAPNQVLVLAEVEKASNSKDQYLGLDAVEEYILLYQGQWSSLIPKGPAPGVLTNYTQDLFFSMERLANSPFSVRRLPKTSRAPPFQVDASTVSNITGSSLQDLLKAGRLFYADHRAQAPFPKTANKFAAACDAYFYIDSKSGQFLPLAIRTNVGANLIYTPADTDADWTLGKILFNINDFFYTQTWHLASTHEVVQIAWMAAIRTLSVDHPIYALLDRLAYQLFSIQPLADDFLFNEGKAFDTVFPVTGSGARNFVSELYFNGTGAFQRHYFERDLRGRGLLGGDGPKLPSFPFYEDASVVHNAIHAFMDIFVRSFYASDAVVRGDTELQAWAAEANGPAKALDFPKKFGGIEDVVGVLTHVAHLVSVVHHSVNTNNVMTISATLPMHPMAVYKPIPTAKGNTSVASFLPPLEASLAQLQVDGLFARPLLANTKRTLTYMFDSSTFLLGTNNKTRDAAATFKKAMQAFSKKVKARAFDEDGLCQGAPFIWRALDPEEAPFSLSI